ncbi:MAG: cyclic pyranopterin monophosphate synthase MoaC [Erysipelotrichaceae bacterium]|nr:cyclic pyranopterin monophosphate synthase MoaC [Erysipelotrichaceae bacterium]
MEQKLNHFDEAGNAVMVDVSQKPETRRTAKASGKIKVSPQVLEAVKNGTAAKGDVLGVARVAGILGVKQTPHLIPLCHPLMIEKVSIDFSILEDACEIQAVCTASLTGKTGVEMEALTGVSTALLTIYDMCKAMDKSMEITDIHVERKEGGKSGLYQRNASDC